MKKKKFILDGTKFNEVNGFFYEFGLLFGDVHNNIDALNDVLRGGMGKFDGNEPIIIVWKNSEKSKIDFSKNNTIKYFGRLFKSNKPSNQLTNRQQKLGLTFYEYIIEIICEHEHIEFQEDNHTQFQ